MSDPKAASAETRGDRAPPGLALLLALCLAAYGILQFRHLGHPLLWQDEGETAMFGQRVLEYGYPKVHGERNVVWGMGGMDVPLALTVNEDDDAYIGSPWGQYYFAALGVGLARRAADPHTKTLLLRLPFALAGCTGLALLFLAAAPALGDGARARYGAAAAWVVLLSLSTSLILHLREVRYYALGVALLGALVLLYARGFGPDRRPQGPLGERLRSALLALVLVALFNVFPPAALSAGLWLLLECLLQVLRPSPAGPAQRLRSAAPIAIAVAAAGVAALPVALYFEVPSLGRLHATRARLGVDLYLANLGLLAHYLLRYEFLGPVILVKLLLLPLVAGGRRALPSSPADRLSAALSRLCGVHALVGAGNPYFFERYFVALSPLLGLVLLLDGTSLARRVAHRVRPEARPGVRLAGIALGALVLTGMLALKRPELSGILAERSRPYRGPLDFIVQEISSRHPDTARLQIATNYEAEPLMYYLGSRVVGRGLHPVGERAAEERAAVVDVVVPRTRQGKKLALVRSYLDHGRFERVELPVADLPFNNVPELFAGRALTTTHRFRTPLPDADVGPVAVYHRIGSRER